MEFAAIIQRIVHTPVDQESAFVNRVTKSIVFPPAQSYKPNIILSPYGTQAEIDISNAYATSADLVSDLGFYFLRDVIMRGRGFFFVDEHLLCEKDLVPLYVKDMIISDQRPELLPDPGRFCRRIADPVLVLTAEAHLIYGHWMLDYLPRAALFRTAFGPSIPNLKLLLPHDTPDYALNLIRSLCGLQQEIISWDWNSEDLYLDRAIVPSMLHNSHIFHPAANLFVNAAISKSFCNPVFATQGRPSEYDMIYVSRHKFRDQLSEIYLG